MPRWRLLGSTALLLVFFSSGLARVQAAEREEIIEALDHCAQISDPAERLDCYDALQKKYGRVIFSGRWKLETKIFPDEAKQIYITLKADTPFETPEKTFSPRLVLRCKGDRTDCYVATGLVPAEGTEDKEVSVSLAFDQKEPKYYRFQRFSNDDVIFAVNPISMIKRLLHHRTMTMVVTLGGSPPVTATFTLPGLENIIDELQQECHWK
jgi:hypothetical protein